MRSSDSECAKKHTRRLQPAPSVHICANSLSSMRQEQAKQCVQAMQCGRATHGPAGTAWIAGAPVSCSAMGAASTRTRRVQKGTRLHAYSSHSAQKTRFQRNATKEAGAGERQSQINLPDGTLGRPFRCSGTCGGHGAWLSPQDAQMGTVSSRGAGREGTASPARQAVDTAGRGAVLEHEEGVFIPQQHKRGS